MLGKLHEIELFASASQWTDMFYILSSGGKRSQAQEVKQAFRKLRQGVRVAGLSESDIDDALASAWPDFEDACVYQAGQSVKAEAIITQNLQDFEGSAIPVFDCGGFFAYLQQEKDLTYSLIDFA